MKGSFYTVEKLGPKQSLTPEGFLLCEEVPISRTGMMIYGPNEVPVTTGPEGFVKIFREEDEVFRAETIASAMGKPVTDDHPEDDVTPDTWKELAHGIALNVRRGTGSLDDLLLADFLITTPEGIKAVQSGKREVSCGYEADYEETAPGIGRQTNIVINHIALVDQGRCGPRCAIGDQQTQHPNKETDMKRSKVLDLLMKAFKAKDAAEVEEIAKEAKDESAELGGADGEGDTHIHIHNGSAEPAAGLEDSKTLDDDPLQVHIDQNAAEHADIVSRIEALEAALAGKTSGAEDEEDPEMMEQMADEVPEDMKEEAAKAKDSSYLHDSFKDTVALAEILVPGIKVPTFDRSHKPGDSFRKICGLRRQALDLAWSQPATRSVLEDLLSGKTLDTQRMTCDAARTLFRSAARLQRAANNNGKQGTKDFDSGVQKAGPRTLADLNRLNKEHYNK